MLQTQIRLFICFLVVALAGLVGCTNKEQENLQARIAESIAQTSAGTRPAADPSVKRDAFWLNLKTALLHTLQTSSITLKSPPQVAFAGLHVVNGKTQLVVCWVESKPNVKSLQMTAGGQSVRVQVSPSDIDQNEGLAKGCVHFAAFVFVEDEPGLQNMIAGMRNVREIEVHVEPGPSNGVSLQPSPE